MGWSPICQWLGLISAMTLQQGAGSIPAITLPSCLSPIFTKNFWINMTPEQFCYWLQGRCELQPQNIPSKEEWNSIVAHLNTVFHRITPQGNKAAKPPFDSLQDYMRRAQDQNRVAPLTGWQHPDWQQIPQAIC